MNEDFIPFELSKKLKEKGFRYNKNNLLDRLCMENQINHPTISQVLKWLREEKKIHIEVSPVFRTCKFSSTIYYTKNGQFIKHFAKLSKNYDSYEEAVIDKMDFVIDRLI